MNPLLSAGVGENYESVGDIFDEFKKWFEQQKIFSAYSLRTDVAYIQWGKMLDQYRIVVGGNTPTPRAALLSELCITFRTQSNQYSFPIHQVFRPMYLGDNPKLLVFYNDSLRDIESWKQNACIYENDKSLADDFIKYFDEENDFTASGKTVESFRKMMKAFNHEPKIALVNS